MTKAFRAILVVLTIVIALASSATIARASQPVELATTPPTCHLTLSNERIPLERGAAFERDFMVNLRTCTFTVGSVRRLTSAEANAKHLVGVKGGSSDSISQSVVGAVLGGDPIVYERESTWDCCLLETTYVDHQQTYSYDGSSSSVSQIGTSAWHRNTGWVTTSGPTQWFNTSNPASSVSTEGTAAFNNTIAPGQPCDHQLWAEVRSYADGTWTHSSSFTGDPGQTICSGLIHVSESWGTR